MTSRSRERSIHYTIKNPDILAERRQRVMEASLEVFAEKGYAGTSVNDIASVAGVSVGSLYKYIKSKDELLTMVMDSVYTTFEQALTYEQRDNLSNTAEFAELIRRILRAGDTCGAGIRLMYREFLNLPRSQWRKFVAQNETELAAIEEVIQRGNASNEFNCQFPHAAAMNVLVCVNWLALNRWALGTIPVDEYIEQQTHLMLMMVGVDQICIIDDTPSRNDNLQLVLEPNAGTIQ